jgi:type II secretion system protein G
MTRKSGFTLIELLVVIAIIAILAGIIFPVFMRAKESAYRSGDMTNMNAIRNALQLYKVDQDAYPPQILGYASYYDPGLTQVMPANVLRAALYPKRIDSIQTMRPAYDRNELDALTLGEWPNADPRPFPTPIKDLNGDGIIDQNDDIAGARQPYGPGSYFCFTGPSCTLFATTAPADAAKFYKVSGYDVAEVRVPPGPNNIRWEIHYTLRWSSFALNGGNRQDDPRQLIYNDPPDDTVVTWNSWFRDYSAGNIPDHTRKDFVLFLGGGARPYDSADISARSWRVLP